MDFRLGLRHTCFCDDKTRRIKFDYPQLSDPEFSCDQQPCFINTHYIICEHVINRRMAIKKWVRISDAIQANQVRISKLKINHIFINNLLKLMDLYR